MVDFGLSKRDENLILLKKYFFNDSLFSLLDRLYRKKIYSQNIVEEFELDVIENDIVVLCNKEELSEEEKVIMGNIKKYYRSKVEKNDLLLYYLFSPIYNDNNTFKKVFGFFDRSVLSSSKKYYKKLIREVIKNYLMGNVGSLTTSKYVMFEYLSSNYVSNEDKPLQEKVVRKILEKNGIDYYELKFILRYLNIKQGEKYRYEACKLYLDSTVPYVDKDGNITTKDVMSYNDIGGHAYGIIVINSNFYSSKSYLTEKKEIPNLLEAQAHESYHYKQLYDFYHLRLTEEALAYLFDITAYNDRERCSKDYLFLPVEYQANRVAYKEMKLIMKKYFNKNEDGKYEYYTKRVDTLMAYGCTAYSKEEVPLIDKYLVKSLEDVVKDNIVLVMVSPLVKLFFHSDGTIKSFKELVNSCKGKEQFNIFYPFLTYMIDKDNDIDFDDLSNVKIIAMMASTEAKVINKMLEGYRYFSKYYESKLADNFDLDQKQIILERLNRFNTYVNYIKDDELKNKLNSLLNHRLLKRYVDSENKLSFK